MASTNMRRESRHSAGFTMIEMLVVLGIIALLAALLFPVLSAARESARITSCSSNLRQLGIAIKMYQEDYGDLPYDFIDLRGSHRPNDPLQPYVRNGDIYHCPDAQTPNSYNDYFYRVFSFLHLAEGKMPKLLEPTPDTVLLYCLNHLQPRGWDYGATGGVFVVLRDQGSVHRIPAGRVKYWLLRNGMWIPPEKPQLGDSIWPVFPDEPWPPSWRDAQ